MLKDDQRASPAASTTTMPEKSFDSMKGSRAHSITVRPCNGKYCLGSDAPMRRLAPAAGNTTQ